MNDLIDRQAAIDALSKEVRLVDGYYVENDEVIDKDDAIEAIRLLPSAHAELFDDTCACNYNDIDEWLPSKCELLDSCPNPVGVACWEQYLKHRAERRTDELGDK